MRDLEKIKASKALDIKKDSYHVTLKETGSVDIPQGEHPWFVPVGAAIAIFALSLFVSWWFLLATIPVSAAGALMPNRKVTSKQKRYIAAALRKDDLSRLADEARKYPSLDGPRYRRAVEQAVEEMEFPKKWDKDGSIKVTDLRAFGGSKPSYVVKTESAKGVFLSAHYNPEEYIWLEHFRKALQLK